MKIITHYHYPPIPINQFDWSAVTDNYEGGAPIGFGKTEAEAIADLCEQLEICPTCYAETCCYDCATRGGNGSDLLREDERA